MANEFPIPADAVAGAQEVEVIALSLFRQASWIYRLSQEYIDATDINVTALNELIRNCGLFVAAADTVRDGGGDFQDVRQAIVRMLEEKSGVTRTPAEVNSILRDLYTEAGTFHTWAVSNFATVFPSVTVGGSYVAAQYAFNITMTASKVAALTTRVEALNQRFA